MTLLGLNLMSSLQIQSLFPQNGIGAWRRRADGEGDCRNAEENTHLLLGSQRISPVMASLQD